MGFKWLKPLPIVAALLLVFLVATSSTTPTSSGAAARRAGLRRVYFGNEWLLSGADYQV